MGTPFQVIYDAFLARIQSDEWILPDELNIASLIDRISKLEGDIEVIIALKPALEGEATTLYLKKILEKYNVKITRLSYGIPMGGDIEYLDPIMISKAWDDRKVIS